MMFSVSFDLITQASSTDSDNDGLPDYIEQALGSNSTNPSDVIQVTMDGKTRYLVDINNDGKSEKLYDGAGRITDVRIANDGTYLIDLDGNNYVYNPVTKVVTPSEKIVSSDFPWLFVIIGVIVAIVLIIVGVLFKLGYISMEEVVEEVSHNEDSLPSNNIPMYAKNNEKREMNQIEQEIVQTTQSEQLTSIRKKRILPIVIVITIIGIIIAAFFIINNNSSTTTSGEDISSIFAKYDSISSWYCEITGNSRSTVGSTVGDSYYKEYNFTTKWWKKNQYSKYEGTPAGINQSTIYRPEGVYSYNFSSKKYEKLSIPILQNTSTSFNLSDMLKSYDNWKIIGKEIFDEKSATIIQYLNSSHNITVDNKIWIWTEKGLPLKIEMNFTSGSTSTYYDYSMIVTTKEVFDNYSFEEIPDSTFDIS